MNLERAAMKGKLAEAEQRIEKLKTEGKGDCSSICMKLNVLLTPIEEMEIAEAGRMMDRLEIIYAEILGLQTEIEKLKRELK